MEMLLIARDRFREIYSDYDIYVRPALRFVLAFACLFALQQYVGQSALLSRIPVLLAASVICALLPWGAISLMMALFLLGNMIEVSFVMTAITAVIMLCIGFLYFGFKPGNAVVMAIIPLCFILKIPFLVPVLLGLSVGAAAAVPAALGVFIWFFAEYFHRNMAGMQSNLTDTSKMLAESVEISGGIFKNEYMILVILAFVLCILIVSVVKELSIDHAWTIAVVAGFCVLALVMVLGGTFVGGTSLIADLLGLLISLVLAIVYEHVFFAVDYAGTEHVQFEDDDYYYYVKAVPKINPYDEDERRE